MKISKSLSIDEKTNKEIMELCEKKLITFSAFIQDAIRDKLEKEKEVAFVFSRPSSSKEQARRIYNLDHKLKEQEKNYKRVQKDLKKEMEYMEFLLDRKKKKGK